MCVELITFVGLFGAPKHLWVDLCEESKSIPFFEEVAMSLTVIFGTFFSISCNKQNAHDKRHVSVQSLNQQSEGAGRYHFKYSTARKTLERPNIFLCPNSAPFLDGFFNLFHNFAQHSPAQERACSRTPGTLGCTPEYPGRVGAHCLPYPKCSALSIITWYCPLDKWWV